MPPANATPTCSPGWSRLGLLFGLATAAALLLAIVVPAADAATQVVGSPLSVPATLNTAENLGYPGLYTEVPVSPSAPTGVFHTFHFGADTALWNTNLASGSASMPASGQALKVSLEGCAKAANGGPVPLSEIHFQDLSPMAGGGAKVNLTSQGFQIPVCGRGGASASTVTSYEPTNLCVSQGDYIGFNDEGGYVENVYRAGVPYQVLGSVRGSTSDSFIRGGGTGDGATFSPSYTSAMEGFASNQNEELLMQVTLGTGSDARYVCSGGTKEAPPTLPAIAVRPQTDGINHERIVAVAVYCRLTPECKGVATLTLGGKPVSTGKQIPLSLRGNATSHLAIRLVPRLMGLIRKHHGVTTTLTAVVGSTTVSQTISVKIL
jgi:hypothetical protein